MNLIFCLLTLKKSNEEDNEDIFSEIIKDYPSGEQSER